MYGNHLSFWHLVATLIIEMVIPRRGRTISGIYIFTGEGNGTPLQYSCLENSVDRGAWWAAVYGVAQSRTRLKWLSSSGTMTGPVRGYCYVDMVCSVLVTQSCLNLCYPMDCSLPGSSVHRILQARTLAWITMPYSRGSSQPRDPIRPSPLYVLCWQTGCLLSDVRRKSF